MAEFKIHEVHTDGSFADYIVIKNTGTATSEKISKALTINDTSHSIDISLNANGYLVFFEGSKTGYTFSSEDTVSGLYDFDCSYDISDAGLTLSLSETTASNISISGEDASFNGGILYAQRHNTGSNNNVADISYAFHLRFKDPSYNVINIDTSLNYEAISDISFLEFGSEYIHQFVQNPGQSLTIDNIKTDTSSNYYIKNEDNVDNGHVFEFQDFDVSAALDISPSFQEAITLIEGFDASAVAQIDVSLDTFNKFFVVKIDAIDISNDVSGLGSDHSIDDINNQDIIIGVSGGHEISNSTTGLLHDISYSKAILRSGAIRPSNVDYDNSGIEYDYVRHLSKEITGGYAAVDIFKNETELRDGVVDKDSDFKTSFNNKLVSAFDISDGNTNNNYFTSNPNIQQTLLNLFLLNLNTTDHTRSQNQSKIFTDITNATNQKSDTNSPYKVLPLHFSKNDRVVFKITYKQKNINPIGNNIINPRSYKILLKLV